MSIKDSLHSATQGSGRALAMVGIAMVIAVFGGGYFIFKTTNTGVEAQSTVVSGVETGKSATGVGGTPEYNRLMAERNRQVAEQAKAQNGSAVITPLEQEECSMELLSTKERLREIEEGLKKEKESNALLQRQINDLNNQLADARRAQARASQQSQNQSGANPIEMYTDRLGQEYMSPTTYQAHRQKIKSEMEALRSNIINPPASGFVAVSTAATGTPAGNASENKVPNAQQGSTKPSIMMAKPGDVLYAVLDTAINSDVPGPVLATVQSGPLKGTRLIGAFKTHDEYVVLEFNQGTLPDRRVVTLKSVAVDPQTTLVGVADDVDNHYLLKFGAIAGAAFLQGYGRAVQMASQKTEYVNVPGSPYPTPIQTHQMSNEQIAKSALADVGAALSQVLSKAAQRPPTVHKYSGSDIGILVLDPVTVKD